MAGWRAEHDEYLDFVPRLEVTHTAYQRLYDTILSRGTQEAYENKEKIISYKVPLRVSAVEQFMKTHNQRPLAEDFHGCIGLVDPERTLATPWQNPAA